MSRHTLAHRYTTRADAMPTAADLFHALPVSGKSLALLLSVSMHAAIALAAARGAPHAAASTSLPSNALLELTTIEQTLSAPPAPASEAPLRPATGSVSARASHHHDYPVPPNHDAAPHDASLRHELPAPSAEHLAASVAPSVLPAAAPAATAPRFVMVVAPAARAPSGTSTGRDVAAGQGASAAAEPAAENAVDTPAKLLAGASPSYTAEAQAAGIEADIPFELVVDSAGSVLSARALSHAGYGLDEAALRSVRAARFSPARRAGKAVAVRMHWLMRFQLR